LRPSANERLFAEHFTADPGLPVVMGVTTDPAFADAMVSYKEGHFAEARTKWSSLLQQKPLNDTLRYYMASASLAIDDAPAAIPLLEALSSDRASAFTAQSRWFLFLAYVKTGEVQKARAMSFDADPTYAERVRAIKAELK
jgi:thioredoxin-like negative regulator of GroEL